MSDQNSAGPVSQAQSSTGQGASDQAPDAAQPRSPDVFRQAPAADPQPVQTPEYDPSKPQILQQDYDQTQNRPADTLRDGSLKATIWRNEGEHGAYYNTKLSKTYEDRNGNLRDGQNFSKSDLLKMPGLTQSAYTRIGELQREHTQSHAQNQEQARQPHTQQPTQALDQHAQQNARAPQGFAESRTAQAPAKDPGCGR